MIRNTLPPSCFHGVHSLRREVRGARAEYRVEPGKRIAAKVLAPADLRQAIEAEVHPTPETGSHAARCVGNRAAVAHYSL